MAISVPIYYKPRPQQEEAWRRRNSGKYDYYFKCQHRQFGKDSDDIQYAMSDAYLHPGTQTAYVGIDNKWIRRNIWDKYLEGRYHWDNYPKEDIEKKDTAQQILFKNNPEGLAPALIQFIGFKESRSLIGSSYDKFYVSELSLYDRGAFDFITPIWDNKKAMGELFKVNFNFTPRGMNNVAVDMLRAYTQKDDPALWPGDHGNVYVDYLPANKSLKADGTRLYSDELLEEMRQRDIRAHGNDNLFRQEFLLDFLAVNAGLVYPAIEVLKKEGRYRPVNLDSRFPVYMAWDISSKDKTSDWTSCIVFQYIQGSLVIYDWYENNRMAVVECVQDLSKRDYFHLIKASALPWDSDRSGSKSSPLQECINAFQNVNWHKLDRSFKADGINRVRQLFPNMLINSDKCEWVTECMEKWEYREIVSMEDWSADPKHDRYSHLMDALRYVADMIDQVPYISNLSGKPVKQPQYYDPWTEEEDEDNWDMLPPHMRVSLSSPLRKKKPSEVYGKQGSPTTTTPGWKHENGLWVPDYN